MRLPQGELRVSTAESLLAVLRPTEHPARHASVIAHTTVSRVTVVALSASLTSVTLGVVATETNTCLTIAHLELLVAVLVAIALSTTEARRGVPVAAGFALLAVSSRRPVLALVAYTGSLQAGRVIVTTAVRSTIRPGPTEIALALVVRCFAAVAIYAFLVARLRAVFLTVAVEAAFALTTETAVSVRADGVGMTIVESEITLVDVGTLSVCPAGLVQSQQRRSLILKFVYHRAAVDVGLIEVALDAATRYGILEAVTPAATERMETARTVRVSAAALALIVAG